MRGGRRGKRRSSAARCFGLFGARLTLGASFRPLEEMRLFRKIEVGTKAFFYHKARAAGAVSDTSVTNDDAGLGWEWDIFCNWRITSDLAYTFRYGAFMPGSAYDGGDRTCRQFLYTGLVFSF